MNRIFSLIIPLFSLFPLFSLAPSTFASSYVDDSVNLEFEYADEYNLRDYTSEFNAGQPDSMQVEKYVLIGPDIKQSQGLFEIMILQKSLGEVLDAVQLRFINADSLSNREVMGITGVELLGTSYITAAPLQAVLFSYQTLTIGIFYTGSNQSEYEAFLKNLSEPTSLSDTRGHEFQREIDDVLKRDIFKGYLTASGAMEFRPDQNINRAEFLKVIVLAAPEVDQMDVENFWEQARDNLAADDQAAIVDEDPNTSPLFPDVDREAWFAPYIFFAFDKGWVGGYPDGTFRPTALVNRAEAAKMILSSRSIFFSADGEKWFHPFLEYLDEMNILIKISEDDRYRFSFSNDVFYPHELTSRAQTAALLSRLVWLHEHSEHAQYARPASLDLLPFHLGDQEYEVFELGRGKVHELSSNTFRVMLGSQFGGDIGVFLPEGWTKREKENAQQSFFSNLLYLGETRSEVFAFPQQCVGPEACEAPPLPSFVDAFTVLRQDLNRFEDRNIGLSFLYVQPLEFKKQVESSIKALQILREDGSEMMVLNLLSNSEEDPQFFQGGRPEGAHLIGNRDWYAYPVQDGEESQLRMVTWFDTRKVLVAVMRGISSFQEVDGKRLRVLRTIGSE